MKEVTSRNTQVKFFLSVTFFYHLFCFLFSPLLSRMFRFSFSFMYVVHSPTSSQHTHSLWKATNDDAALAADVAAVALPAGRGRSRCSCAGEAGSPPRRPERPQTRRCARLPVRPWGLPGSRRGQDLRSAHPRGEQGQAGVRKGGLIDSLTECIINPAKIWSKRKEITLIDKKIYW